MLVFPSADRDDEQLHHTLLASNRVSPALVAGKGLSMSVGGHCLIVDSLYAQQLLVPWNQSSSTNNYFLLFETLSLAA